MKKQLFALATAFAFASNAAAEELKVQNQFGETVNVTLEYCRGSKVTKYLHFTHELALGAIEDMAEAIVKLVDTKKIRLQKMVLETASQIITITFEDNKIKLNDNNIVVIKKDGVYYKDAKLSESKERYIITKAKIAAAAVVAAQA